MDADLLIKLGMDPSQAKQATDQFLAELKKIEGETAKVGAAREKLEQHVAEVRLAAERKAAAEQERLNGKLLTEEQVQQKARAALIEETNRRRIKAAVEGSQVETQAHGTVTTAIEGSTGALLKYVGTFATLATARQIVGSIGAAFDDAAKRTHELALETGRVRDALREIAFLKGETGPNNQVLGTTLALMAKTGATVEEATTAQEQFYSSTQLAVQQGKISKKDADAFLANAVNISLRAGISGKTAGELSGVIPLLGATSTAKATQDFHNLINIASPARGNMDVIAKAIADEAGAIVGSGMMTLPQLAALSTAASFDKPEQTSERVQQLTRLGFSNDRDFMRKHKINPEEYETTAEWLQQAGIDEKESSLQVRLDRLVTQYNKDRAAALARGEQFAGQEYLIKRGVRNIEDRVAFLGLVARQGEWTTAQRIAASPPSEKETAKFMREWLEGDTDESRAGRMRRAQALERTSKLAIGEKGEEGAIGMTLASSAQQRDDLNPARQLTDWLVGVTSGHFQTAGENALRRRRLSAVLNTLRRNVIAAHLDPGQFGLGNFGREYGTYAAPSDSLDDIGLSEKIASIRQAGVKNPLAGLDAEANRLLSDLVHESKEQTSILRSQANAPLSASPRSGGAATPAR